MKYVIGIDSGATSSEAALTPVYINSPQAATKKYPFINLNLLGFGESAKRLEKIIRSLSQKVGMSNVISIAAGVSGARYEKDRKRLEQYLKKKTGIKKIQVLPDTEIAFASAFEPNEKNCGILIAGTGSILYYRDNNGKLIRIGGWGRHIGDEGSGYWIAREALYRVTKHFDGRQKKTMLASVLKKEFGIDSANIIKHVYQNGFEISQLTKHVFSCAEKGDRASRGIIKSASENLLAHFIPLKNRKCRIALMGSLFTEEALLSKNLRKLLKQKYKNINLVKPKHNPVWGAVKIAISSIEK